MRSYIAFLQYIPKFFIEIRKLNLFTNIFQGRSSSACITFNVIKLIIAQIVVRVYWESNLIWSINLKQIIICPNKLAVQYDSISNYATFFYEFENSEKHNRLRNILIFLCYSLFGAKYH